MAKRRGPDGAADGDGPATRLTGVLPDEGTALLFRDGSFLSKVGYTLVTVEKAAAAGAPLLYTGVLRFSATARSVSEQFGINPIRLELETAGGVRLSCRPVEPLGSARLRWVVRLS